MAEYAAILIAEFNIALNDLKGVTAELLPLITDANTADPTSMNQLDLHTIDTTIAMQQLEKMKPSSSRKSTPYPYEEALQPIADARRAIARAQRILQRHVPEVTTQNTSSVRRQIPEVKIQPFTGNVVSYSSFIAAFKMKFDALPISGAEKLQQLKENVTGNPLLAIKPLELTDSNYEKALHDLNKQYNRPDDVIEALYSQLESMPRSSNSNADLSATYFGLEGILSALESHGHTLDTFPPLKKKIYTKYPSWLVNQICAKELLPVKEFQAAVATALSIRTSLNPQDPTRTSNSTYHANAKKEKKGEKPQAASGSGGGKSGEKSQPPCVFCNERHYSNACPTYTTLTDRKALVQDRCSLCLSKAHNFANCTKKSKCFHCHEPNAHHQALCPNKFGKPTATSDSTPKSTGPPENKTERLIAFAKTHNGAHTTALVTLINPETKHEYSTRVLFDNGSSETYISENAAWKFGLTLGKFRPTPVSVFGVTDPVRVRSATTTFQITNKAGFRVDIVGDTMPQVPQDVHLFDYHEFSRVYPNYADTPLLDQGL